MKLKGGQKGGIEKTLLFLLASDKLGGAELVLKNIAKHYISEGNSVVVVFLKSRLYGGWDDLLDKCEMHFSKYQKEKYTFPYQLRKAFLLSRRKKIIYTFSSHNMISGLWGVFRGLGILKTKYLILRESTLILDRFFGIKRFFFKLSYRFGYPKADLVICQTELMKSRLASAFPLAKQWNLVVIPNLVDIDYIKGMSKVSVDDLSFEYILGVGRLIKLKGFDLLIRAFGMLDDKKIKLLILGDGPEDANLKELVSSLGLEKRVLFKGYISNPYPYMGKAKLNVISSFIEGFPNTLLQMMILNNRIVSTRCAGGIEEIDGLITCDTSDLNQLFISIKSALNLTDDVLFQNRVLFDKELSNRSLGKFVSTVEKCANEC